MDKYNYRETENQSFSSTLLDAIYRSIDEPHPKFTTGLKDKLPNNDPTLPWMDSKSIPLRRKSAADFQRKPPNYDSSSSSSDSSCGGGGIFSSSELESVYGSASTCRPKPIRTSLHFSHKQFNVFDNYYPTQEKNPLSQPKSKQEGGGFVKTKSRALKIYGDLKKVKQPISPGGRLATFLNSLFTPGNTKKKTKSSSTSARSYGDVSLEMKSKSAQTSTCSSASSFSRSCLSKNPSTKVKSSNGAKRSVHFYPVSVIVDEDLKPYGHKPNFRDVRISEEKNRRVEKNWQKMNVEREFVMRNIHMKNKELEDEDDDDDCASCASSDLFELDSLRYREELPVYETTHFDRNRAIASGMIDYVTTS